LHVNIPPPFPSEILDPPLIMDNYIPSKTIQINHKQPWISYNIKQLRRSKQRYYNKARSSNSTSDWNRFRNIKRPMQGESRFAFNQYIYKTVHTPYENEKQKRFCKYIKSLQSNHTGIPSLKRNGQSYTPILLAKKSEDPE